MKRVFSLIILGFFLVSCVARSPFDAAKGKPVKIEIPMNATPKPTPAPIRLSPINAGNVDQIQPLYKIHLKEDPRTEDVLAISTNKMWAALTPKDGAPLHFQRLKWASDGSFVPMGNGFSTFSLYQTASVVFSPDAMHAAIANQADNSVLVYDLAGLPGDKEPTRLSIGDRPEAITFTKDSQRLFVGTQNGGEGSVQLWDLKTASKERDISRNTPGGVCSVSVSPDGKLLAAGSCMKTFNISTWEIGNNDKPLSQLISQDGCASCTGSCTMGNMFAFNPVTGEIASIFNYPHISFLDPHTGTINAIVTAQLADDSLGGVNSISTLAFTSDGTLLLITVNQALLLIDTKDGKMLWHHENPKRITAATLSADSTLLTSVNSDGDWVFWGVPAR